MTDKELKLGMVVNGSNKVMNDTGKIKDIHQSSGSRKGLLYKVGINYYFADEIRVDWNCILEMIGQGNVYKLKTPFKYVKGGVKKVAEEVCFKDNFELVGNGFQDKIYEIATSTIRKLYWQIVKEKGILE